MGIDYTASAIIGILIPEKDNLPRAVLTVRKKAFKHNYEDDGELEFDSKSGKKLWLDEKEEIKADYPAFMFGDDADPEDLLPGQKILKTSHGLKFYSGSEDTNWCLGVGVSTGSSRCGDELGFKPLPDINRVKEELKKLLEPVGLWDESKFGLYAQLSYY